MYKYRKEIIDTIVLKCETQKTFEQIGKKSNIWELLLSIATTYSYGENRYRIWTYNKQQDLIKYLDGKNIVCFNGTRFDIPLITGKKFEDRTYMLPIDGNREYSVVSDIFMHILHVIYRTSTYTDTVEKLNKSPIMNMQSYSLYNVYCNTLNRNVSKKTYNVKTTELFENKKILELIEVSLFKLRMVKELYEFILKNRYIVNGDFDILKIDDIASPNNVDSDMFLPF